MDIDSPMGRVLLRPGQTLCLRKGDLRRACCPTETHSIRMRWEGTPPPRAKGVLSMPARAILDHLLLLFQRKDFSKLAQQHLLQSFVVTLNDGGLSEVRSQNNSFHLDFQPWIDRAIKGESNIAEGARDLGLHPDHFTRTFKSRYGLPPKKWLMEQRFLLALQWIEEDGLGTSEVVKALGLEDVSLFCLQFRKRFDCSPGAWKTRMLKGGSHTE